MPRFRGIKQQPSWIRLRSTICTANESKRIRINSKFILRVQITFFRILSEAQNIIRLKKSGKRFNIKPKQIIDKKFFPNPQCHHLE